MRGLAIKESKSIFEDLLRGASVKQTKFDRRMQGLQVTGLTRLPMVSPRTWRGQTRKSPLADHTKWFERMQSIRELSPLLENDIARFASASGDLEYAREWNANSGGMVVLTNSEDLDMSAIAADKALSVFLDILLPGLAFSVECGLKCLRCCDGYSPKWTHNLEKLYKDLRYTLKDELQRAYVFIQKHRETPDGVVLIPRISSVLRNYSEIYDEIRYRTDDSWPERGRSAYFNLGMASDAIFMMILNHESYGDMRIGFELTIPEAGHS